MTYPTILPKLTLDFANSRQLDPRITFSRSSSATYLHPDTGLITTAPSDVARFEEQGLLVEGASTNLLTFSEQFDNAEWVTVGVDAPTADSTTAPDGTLTADTLTCSAATSYIYDQLTGLATATYRTFSVFVKKGSADYCWLSARGHQFAYFVAVFDLTTGECTQQGTKNDNYFPLSQNYALESTPLGNGWFRLSIVSYTPTYPTLQFKVGFTSQGTGNALVEEGLDTATPGETMFVWGAQVEEGFFPTSYIPTAGSTVTRAADLASMTGTNFSSWYNQSEGTLFLESSLAAELSGSNYYLSIDDGGNSNFIRVLNVGTNPKAKAVIASSGTNVLTGTPPNDVSSPFKIAVGIKQDDYAYVLQNNDPISTSSADIAPPLVDRLQIGGIRGFAPTSAYHFKRIAYYPVRLPDEQLQALTA